MRRVSMEKERGGLVEEKDSVWGVALLSKR
jgi:hypothetical protein